MSDIEFGKEVHYHYWDDSIEFVTLDPKEHYAVELSPTGPECATAGCVFDVISNWETTEAMALEGKKMQAIDPGNQPKVDAWMEQYRDCFGE